MMIHFDDLLAILAMALANYLTRISGFLIGNRLPKHGPIRRGLDALPAAVLTAVVAPDILTGPAEMIGAIATLIALTRLPMVGGIVVGVVSVAMMRYYGLT